MAKITLPDIASQFASQEALNDRFNEIEKHLNDNVLYRDNPVSEPNEMRNDLDMNLNDIINIQSLIVDGVDLAEAVRAPTAPDSEWGDGINQPTTAIRFKQMNGDWGVWEDIRGYRGLAGPDGSTGLAGDKGDKGDKGDTGADSTVAGPQGIQGVKGDTGATGADSTVAGPKGDQGIQGIQGVAGVAGADGDDGAQGIQGVKGDKGDDGADSTVAGPQGIQGIQGIDGAQGPAGNDGTDGTSVDLKGSVPTFSALPSGATAGDLWVVADEAGEGYVSDGANGWSAVGKIQGPKGDTGHDGIQGVQGIQGTAGTHGIDGVDGTDGDDGAQGIQGIAGVDGADGSQGIQGIQGVKGDTGPAGADGVDATPYDDTAVWAATDLNTIRSTTAFGWGDHSTAGYATNSALGNYLPLTGGILTGQLTATEAIVSSKNLGIGTGGTYAAGTIYADSSWGMILRAAQASPAEADFLFTEATGIELLRMSIGGASFAGGITAGGGATIIGDLTVTGTNVATDSALLGGLAASAYEPVNSTPSSGNWWSGGYSRVNGDGTHEIGRFIDWHSTSADTADYTYRMDNYAVGEMAFSGGLSLTGILNVQGQSVTAAKIIAWDAGTGGGTGGGQVNSVVAGANVTVDSSDPANPIVSATGGGGGGLALTDAGSSDAYLAIEDYWGGNSIMSSYGDPTFFINKDYTNTDAYRPLASYLTASVSGGTSLVHPVAGNDTAGSGTKVLTTHPTGVNVSGELQLGGYDHVKYLSGVGSPQGVKTAPVGSMYTRTDGGVGSTLYVKESGTGNTGWSAK